MITAIVAYDENRVIGKDGKIPWNIPEDRKFFQQQTIGSALIMGRKTWESIPLKKRPLKGRFNLILSKTCRDHGVGYLFVDKMDTAIWWAKYVLRMDNIFIIGGAEIFKIALEKDLINRIIVSKIYGIHEGDAYFPEIKTANWEVHSPQKFKEFEVVEYVKSDEQGKI